LSQKAQHKYLKIKKVDTKHEARGGFPAHLWRHCKNTAKKMHESVGKARDRLIIKSMLSC